MLTATVAGLKTGDVFSADHGETWWRVEHNNRESAGTRRLYCVCVGSGADDVATGDHESVVFNDDDEVVVRI